MLGLDKVKELSGVDNKTTRGYAAKTITLFSSKLSPADKELTKLHKELRDAQKRLREAWKKLREAKEEAAEVGEVHRELGEIWEKLSDSKTAHLETRNEFTAT